MERDLLLQKVGRLLDQQRIGVLCMSSDAGPYGSPVVFVAGEGLCSIAFATPRRTAKYEILLRNPAAALVVDNRSDAGTSPSAAEVVVASCTAREVTDASEAQALREDLAYRHPQFKPFFEASQTAFIRLAVAKYRYVSGLEAGEDLPM